MKRGIWLTVVVVLLAAAAGAWYFRGDLLMMLAGASDPVEVSPEAADAAESKLTALIEDGREARLSEVELSSLLRYRSSGFGESTVSDPSVQMSNDTLVLTGTIATDSLPPHPDLDAVRPLLPDRAPVEVTGRVSPLGRGRAAFEISSVEFAGLPVPSRYYGEVLDRVGRIDEPGLAPNAMAVRLPSGVRGVRVEGGYLILTP